MDFFERYQKVCLARGVKPVSEAAAQNIGVTRATISAWKTLHTTPKAKTVSAIARFYGVSQDYLLGRTDEIPGYTDQKQERTVNIQLNENEQETKKAPIQQETVKEPETGKTYTILPLYDQLDDTDKIRVEGFIQGLLSQEKYAKRKVAL